MGPMMHLARAIIALFVCNVAAFALEAELSALRSALPSNDPNLINNALIQLNSTIGKYEAVDRSSWDKPSAERLQRRHDIMTALEQLPMTLLNLIRKEKIGNAAWRGRMLKFR